MQYSILALLKFVILSHAVVLPSSISDQKSDINPNIISQNQPIPQPIVKINLDTIANVDTASTDNAIHQELVVDLELSATLPPSSGLQKPVSLPSSLSPTSSSSSSTQLFYYGWTPLGQSMDVTRASITEGPQGVKCKLYSYLLGGDGLGYDAMVLTVGNALDFKKGPFKKVSSVDCVAERMVAEEGKESTTEGED